MRSPSVLVLCAAALGLLSQPLSAAVPAVEIVADTPWIQPTSTLEFRFARPMISKEEVGVQTANPPFRLEPPMPGRFTWLSRSSGVFVPEVAWPLDAKFLLTTAPDLRAADGKPLGGAARVELRTPAFQNTHVRGGGDEQEVAARAEVGLAFNLAVDAAAAAKLAMFVNSDGRAIPAQVRHATSRDYYPLPPEKEDWQVRWEQSRAPAAEDPSDDDADSRAPTPKPNRLMVTPAQPLSPGGEWRLEVSAGLRSADGRHVLKEPLTVALGAVQPFQITTLEPASYVNSGRSVVLTFSHPLAPDITAATAGNFVRVEPPVDGLRFEESFNSLTLRGDFQRDQEYALHFEPALISAEGLPLEGERVRPVRFAPVAPRLYLPEITTHQARGGKRKLEVAAVNLRSIAVVARRVPPREVPRAVEAFSKYHKEEYSETEPYQPLPPDAIPGPVIHESVIEMPELALDGRQQISLDWDQLLGAEAAGAVFLTLTGEPRPDAPGKPVAAQALVQLTDIGVLWKHLEEGLRVSTFSMRNGTPLPKAQAVTLNETFQPMQRGATDAAGLVTLPVSEAPAWLLVTTADDVHALRIGSFGEELPMAAFRLPIDYRSWSSTDEPRRPLRASIFTDRPLYRPGEIVRVKGLVRALEEEGLAIEAALQGSLVLRDPRGEEAGTVEVKTDERGAFDAELPLPSGSQGAYRIGLELPGMPNSQWRTGFNASFQVTDYQPNAFEVAVDLPERIAPGAPVQAALSARYYFGSPVRDATARWTLRYARESFSPEGFDAWRFGVDEDSTAPALTLQGTGDLKTAAQLAIAPQLPDSNGAPHRGVLSVEVTDINQQTVTDARSFSRDASAFYLGVTVPDGLVYRAGDEIPVATVAVGPNGQPLPEPVEVQAELIRVHHHTVRVQSARQSVSFRTEKQEEPLAQIAGRTVQPERVSGEWQAGRRSTASFRAPQAGQYRVRVTAKDAAGRPVETDYALYVSGPDQLAWDYRNPAQMELVADKTEYRPGDVARLLVKSPISGEALVTVERDARILRTMRVQLEGNAPTFDIPLSPADAPNVFVSVVLVRGSEASTRQVKTPEYRYGAAMLRVRDPEARLQVAVLPVRPEVEPGDEVTADVIVRDGGDRPVADAEVTFFAVDDGVLALTGYERPMPGEIFGAPVPLAVKTGLSLHRLLPEDPAALEFNNKGYLIGGGGLEGPGLKLRRDFPGTAAWFPSLRTDAEGKVRVRFRAPDALTRYRLVAVAHAAAHLFGSGESSFGIRKSLMVLPALGQFANLGDELIARAVVRNETEADGVVEIALELDSTAEPSRPEGATARVELRKGEARAVDIPVRLVRTGSAEWKWSARMALPGRALEDHVLSTLAIGSPAPLLRETYLTDLRGATAQLFEGVNPQLLEGSGVVAATVSNTRLSSLRAGIHQLLEYPYGCAEQTTSAIIPWGLFTELRPILPEIEKTDAEVADAIQAGLTRLFAQQTPAGGIAMWPGDMRDSVFLSAYAAVACAILQAHEIDLPAGYDKLLEYLSNSLRNVGAVRDEPLLGDHALALYALALSGKAEPAYHEMLFQRRRELSRESRALLASAVLEAKGPARMVAQLLDPKDPAPEATSWFGGVARERAIQLLAWTRYKPQDPEVARLVKELLGHRRSGHWGTTQANAWALLALSRYYAAVERGGPAVIAGEVIARDIGSPFRVTKASPTAFFSFGMEPGAPLEGVTVRNPSKAPLFGETRFAVHPPVSEQPRQDRGFAVSRSYQRIATDDSLQEAKDLKVGDRVLVTLRVETSRPGHFVAIDDPLPAIFEAVNPAFQSRAIAGRDRATDWASDHREMRADRVLYFCDHLPAGAFTFRYLARVRAAGTVTAGATKVEEMYRPERFGLSEITKLAALPAEGR